MLPNIELNKLKTNPQKILNGEVHNWYRIALGFSDQLVSTVLDRFALKAGDWVLDPFCGSGTTLVECKKRGIHSIGIDANPSSYFASKVKTNWSVGTRTIAKLANRIGTDYSLAMRNHGGYKRDLTYKYLIESGMIERGWISPKPLMKSIYLKNAILSLDATKDIENLLMLALIDEVLTDASNIKFGPQPYCSTPKENVDVLQGFLIRVKKMATDLEIVKKLPYGKVKIHQGDSRRCNSIIDTTLPISAVICSPPYPGEHDYTRHSRLELAFLEEVTDKETLRQIKRQMIRSNTKGIYKEDNDCDLVSNNPKLLAITREIDKKAKTKTHGFARLYSTVVLEYFGGMKRHLQNLHDILPPGAQCAYVVGDQSSYLQVHIPTAKILADIANEVGYEYIDIIPWRTAWASKTSKKVEENILIMKKK